MEDVDVSWNHHIHMYYYSFEINDINSNRHRHRTSIQWTLNIVRCFRLDQDDDNNHESMATTVKWICLCILHIANVSAPLSNRIATIYNMHIWNGLVKSDGWVDINRFPFTFVVQSCIHPSLRCLSPSIIFNVNETMSFHKTLYSIIIENTDRYRLQWRILHHSNWFRKQTEYTKWNISLTIQIIIMMKQFSGSRLSNIALFWNEHNNLDWFP